jgi:multidrug efflux pump subunit AcrA (membrane-fusion protein)
VSTELEQQKQGQDRSSGLGRAPCYGWRMKPATCALTAAALLLILAGCAADTRNYPSLARRAVERGSAAAPAPAPPAPTPQPPSLELTARLAALVEQARIAHGRFESKQGLAGQTVAAGSGAARGSESWAVASIALAELESARSAAMIALADLDQLYAAARIEGSNSAAIAEARNQVIGWIGEEDRVLAAMRGRLGG